MSRKEKIFDSNIYMYKLQAPTHTEMKFIDMKIILIKIYTAFILFGMGMYEHYKNFR